jgi:hypothetical protein
VNCTEQTIKEHKDSVRQHDRLRRNFICKTLLILLIATSGLAGSTLWFCWLRVFEIVRDIPA